MANSTVFLGVKVTLFGHASVMLEADGQTIYVDPYVVPSGAKMADAIFYTHGHFDYCVPAPQIKSSRTMLFGSKSCKLPVRIMEAGSKENIGGISAEAVEAYTGGGQHPKGSGVGYIFQFKSARVYIAGDTGLIPEMKGYKCDIAIVPIGGTYTMDSSEAAEALSIILPKVAIPYHYNYLSDLRANPEEFRLLVEQKTAGRVDVRVLIF